MNTLLPIVAFICAAMLVFPYHKKFGNLESSVLKKDLTQGPEEDFQHKTILTEIGQAICHEMALYKDEIYRIENLIKDASGVMNNSFTAMYELSSKQQILLSESISYISEGKDSDVSFDFLWWNLKEY